MCSCGPAWETVQDRCAGDVTGDLAARVMGERHALAHMADPSKASACCDAQKDDKAQGIVRRKGRMSESQTTALAVQEKKRPCPEYMAPARMW